MREEWRKAQRVVVKIGSSLLVDATSNSLRQRWLQSFIEDVAALKQEGREVVIVSSGSVALGREALGFARGRLKLEESQAAAAVGQIELAHAYRQLLDECGLTAAQVLLTLGDTEERRHYLNARNTLTSLLRLGAVPVVNENDTVATSEIRYGDNDRLAARVATMISAHVLVVLSDVDGLYTAPPGEPGARHIAEVRELTPEIVAMAGGIGTDYGSGGMKTKIAAARIALAGGTHMVITSGTGEYPLRAFADGGRASWFLAQGDPVTARKRWIAGTLEPRGSFTIDAGALRALRAGNSLLPAGIIALEGSFDRGDAVCILDENAVEIGRGLTAYASYDARRLLGHKSSEIEEILGYAGRTAMIHRDDMILRPEAGGAAEWVAEDKDETDAQT